jgi:hypothetical protein
MNRTTGVLSLGQVRIIDPLGFLSLQKATAVKVRKAKQMRSRRFIGLNLPHFACLYLGKDSQKQQKPRIAPGLSWLRDKGYRWSGGA